MKRLADPDVVASSLHKGQRAQGAKEQPAMEHGAIDLHTKHSQIRIVTADGTVVLDRRIVTRPDQFAAMFGGRDRLRILLEASTESEWVATCLEGLGHEVVVADPNFAAMYGTRTRRIKTDRRDVAALADANRTGVYRPAYRVSPAQRAVRQRLLVRDQLVRLRTQLINLLRSQVRATGRRVPTGAAETFGRRFAALELPALVREALRPLTDLLEGLAIPLREAEAWAHQAAAADPVARRLMTAPGVGPVTALSYRATLGQVERFPDAGRVTAYLGLVPREDSSAERRHRGAITKAGPGRPRALLVQASWHIWRNSRGDATALHAWVHRVAARRGRRIALVALARRLARCLYAMWRDSRNFDGTRVRVIAAAA
jgi:transposase